MNLFLKSKEKIKLSRNRQRIARNLFWALLGKTVNVFGGLLVGIIIARFLGPEKYGLMNYVISYVTLFSILATFGLENIEIRELAKHNGDKEVILGTAFALRVFFAILTVLLISLTLYLFEADAFTALLVFLYSFSLLFSTLNIIRNYFTSQVLNEYVVKSEIFRTIIGAIIKIGLLVVKASLIWFVIAMTFDFVLVSGGYIVSYRKQVGPLHAWKFDRKAVKYLLSESFPLLLSGTVVIIYQKINQLLIRNFMGSADLGQFAVAAKLSELIVFIPQIIVQTVTPILIEIHQIDLIKYRDKRQQFMDIMLWSMIAISLAVSLLSYWIVRVLFGVQYLKAVPVLQVLAWSAVGMSMFLASGQVIILEGIQKYAVLRNLLGCLICVALNMLLIPRYGIIGAAASTVITMAFIGVLSHAIIKPFRFLFFIQIKSLFVPMRFVKSFGSSK